MNTVQWEIFAVLIFLLYLHSIHACEYITTVIILQQRMSLTPQFYLS